MFSTRILSSSAFCFCAFPLFSSCFLNFFPVLQKGLQYCHHSPLQNLHLPCLLGDHVCRGWQQESGGTQASLTLTTTRLYALRLGDLLFPLAAALSLPQLLPEVTVPPQGHPEWSVCILSLCEGVGLCLNTALRVGSNHPLFLSHLLQVQKWV